MGGTSNVEHGDFILLRPRKVLTVAQAITPSEDDVLYTGETAHITAPDWCYCVRVFTIRAGEVLLNSKRSHFKGLLLTILNISLRSIKHSVGSDLAFVYDIFCKWSFGRRRLMSRKFYRYVMDPKQKVRDTIRVGQGGGVVVGGWV